MANEPSKRDLKTEADEALDAARSMPNGPEENEALKKAGMLRKAADDAAGITFAKRGEATAVRPPQLAGLVSCWPLRLDRK
jgi:hypothetical protein